MLQVRWVLLVLRGSPGLLERLGGLGWFIGGCGTRGLVIRLGMRRCLEGLLISLRLVRRGWSRIFILRPGECWRSRVGRVRRGRLGLRLRWRLGR